MCRAALLVALTISSIGGPALAGAEGKLVKPRVDLYKAARHDTRWPETFTYRFKGPDAPMVVEKLTAAAREAGVRMRPVWKNPFTGVYTVKALNGSHARAGAAAPGMIFEKSAREIFDGTDSSPATTR